MSVYDWYQKALVVATEAHKGQMDDSGRPYILHPIHVAADCELWQSKVIALLHDVVEDTDVTLDRLRKLGFPDWVVDGVDDITHRDGESLRDYLTRVNANSIARLAKIADIHHNMSWERIKDLPVERQIRLVAKGIRSLHYLRYGEWYETPELKAVLKQGAKPDTKKTE